MGSSDDPSTLQTIVSNKNCSASHLAEAIELWRVEYWLQIALTYQHRTVHDQHKVAQSRQTRTTQDHTRPAFEKAQT